jgi:hypothetical protein
MAGIQLFFGLLQLAFFLGDLLLKHHLHLGLHLGKLLFVECALLFLLDSWIDLLEHAWILSDTHSGELLRSVVLIQRVVGMFLELFHMCSDKHLAKLNEVTVLLVINFNDTPWVTTSTDLAAVGTGYLRIGSNYSKWNLGNNLVILSNCLLVIELVSWTFEYLDIVVLDVSQDLAQSVFANQIPSGSTYPRLERHDLLIGHGIGLCDDWNQVDLGMQSAHDLNVQRLQGMASWLNEVHASMYSVINNVHAVDLVLSVQIGIKALFNVVHNWSPRLVVVDEVTETRSVNHSQP